MATLDTFSPSLTKEFVCRCACLCVCGADVLRQQRHRPQHISTPKRSSFRHTHIKSSPLHALLFFFYSLIHANQVFGFLLCCSLRSCRFLIMQNKFMHYTTHALNYCLSHIMKGFSILKVSAQLHVCVCMCVYLCVPVIHAIQK